jgi:hypothetical protein
MNYYSKYQKYKLKFLNLRKQIGGAVIWECEIYSNHWEYYTPEESQIIESSNVGTFKLPSKFTIIKNSSNTGFQQGLSNRRNIRRTIVNDRIMERIVEASRFLNTVKRFPDILSQDSNDLDMLRGSLMTIFNNDGGAFLRLGWDWSDGHTAQYAVLYQAIIRLRKPLKNITLGDILRLMNVIFPMPSEQEIEQDRIRREEEEQERIRREEEDKFPEGDTYGNGMYGR